MRTRKFAFEIIWPLDSTVFLIKQYTFFSSLLVQLGLYFFKRNPKWIQFILMYSNKILLGIYYSQTKIYLMKFLLFLSFDLSIGSTETKYIKLNTKTQNIFCYINENLATFLYTLTGEIRKQKEKKKVFSLKVYTKVECYFKKIGF